MVDEIKTLQEIQNAAISTILSEDKELTNCDISNSNLYKELVRRDAAFKKGEINLTTRQGLTNILKSRREASK